VQKKENNRSIMFIHGESRQDESEGLHDKKIVSTSLRDGRPTKPMCSETEVRFGYIKYQGGNHENGG
jgi:hypothetical protein